MTLEMALLVLRDLGYLYIGHYLSKQLFVQEILQEIDEEFSEEELDGIISDVENYRFI